MIHSSDAMETYKASRAGSIDAARITAVDRHLGSVEVGKVADLVVVDGNPLAKIIDVYRVKAVVNDGRPYDLPEPLAAPK